MNYFNDASECQGTLYFNLLCRTGFRTGMAATFTFIPPLVRMAIISRSWQRFGCATAKIMTE
jgi:hypothetical protein